MTRQLLFKVTVASVILFCTCASAGRVYADEDGFGRAQKIEGKHFTISYAPEVSLADLIQQLNVTPSDKFLVGKAQEEGFSLEAELADMLDTLFTRVCDILDMQLYSFKGNIK
ncbi:MAG: hypothetical protein HY350_04020, partial [Candidatus Omnitrophica bacterium]|nr:hypothetical protein [Candidatus Omnitrophota bacterium]